MEHLGAYAPPWEPPLERPAKGDGLQPMAMASIRPLYSFWSLFSLDH